MWPNTSHVQIWPDIQKLTSQLQVQWLEVQKLREGTTGGGICWVRSQSEWEQGGEIWGQQALSEWAGRWRLSDNLIMASPHCNGWNRPAELQGGADRPSTQIAPRAGPMLDGRGPPREREKKNKKRRIVKILTSPQHTTDCQSEPSVPSSLSLPQNTELHNSVIGQAVCHHLCFYWSSDSVHKVALNFHKWKPGQHIINLQEHIVNIVL